MTAARWPLGIFFGGLLIALAGSLAWPGKTTPAAIVAPLVERGEYEGEAQELRFWLAALQRMDAEQRQQLNGSTIPSLRREQATVLQRMRDAASRMPADRVPPEVRPLIEPAAPPPGEPVVAARPATPAPPIPQAELRVGLRSGAPAEDFSTLAVEATTLLPVFERRHPARRAAASDAATGGDEKRATKDREEKRAAKDRDDKRPAKDRDEKRAAKDSDENRLSAR